MWAKILIVVTCLYVAQASVPSIFDDVDVSNLAEVTRTARSCSFSGCNSFCRKLGHARGVCIGSYCQCRFRRRRSLDAAPAVDNSVESSEKAARPNEETLVGNGAVSDVEPETFVAIEEDKSTKDVTVRTCGYAECNSFCRKLGYARGVCIGNYCQCRYRMASPLTPSAELQQEIADEGAVETGDKTPVASYEESSASDASDHGRVVRAARPCSTEGCTNHCRKLGHARGVCIGSYCQCRSRLARSTDSIEGAATENKVDASDKTPIPSAHEETFVGIIIVNDKTSADDAAKVDEDELSKNEESKYSSVRACDILTCNRMCRGLGFLQGVCIGTYCQCRNFRSFSEIAGNTIGDNFIIPTNGLVTGNEVNPEVFEARSEDCNLRWCEQNCRRIGFPGGACVNGRCKCDIRRSAMPAVPAPFTFDDKEERGGRQTRAVRRCTASLCAQICRRLGFRFSRCSGTRCICWR